ncbi:MAG: glycosyltransferase, partial [Parachlamydiaceae bacterium]|nr:glycosyltransferase [Parachlamydiaceae bacterium]
MLKLGYYFRLMILAFLLGEAVPSFSAPDLTIIGFFEPEGGIGKVPLNICECLGDSVSTNFIDTLSNCDYSHKELSQSVFNIINNPDQEPGRVALLTDTLWDICRKPADQVPKDSIVKLAYTMLETTKIPSMWVTILNNEFDAVVVPDKFLVQVYQDCGVTIPVFVLPIPMILKPYLDYSGSKQPFKKFIFGDASANKNPKIVLEAFAKAFKNNPRVSLVL